jgi:hypothetical protein
VESVVFLLDIFEIAALNLKTMDKNIYIVQNNLRLKLFTGE